MGVRTSPCVPQDSAVLEGQSLIAGPGAQSWPFLSSPPAPTPPTHTAFAMDSQGFWAWVWDGEGVGVSTRAVRTSLAPPSLPPEILSSLPSPPLLPLQPNLFTTSEAHPAPITPDKEGGVLGKWRAEVPSLPRLDFRTCLLLSGKGGKELTLRFLSEKRAINVTRNPRVGILPHGLGIV